MDHVASREGPNSVVVHKYLPYIAHQAGYQIPSDIWVQNTVGLYTGTSKLKWSFWTSHHWMWLVEILSKSSPVEIRSSQLDVSNKLSYAPNEDRMQKLHPRKVDVSTTPIGARKCFGVSSSGVRVLDFLYVKKDFGASL
jgi:hypothetical protein